jgi:hypothetical protein
MRVAISIREGRLNSVTLLRRFGLYATDVLRLRPDDFDPDLPQTDFTDLAAVA